jgi:hypothetical protein
MVFAYLGRQREKRAGRLENVRPYSLDDSDQARIAEIGCVATFRAAGW